jgi:hypothetical protein
MPAADSRRSPRLPLARSLAGAAALALLAACGGSSGGQAAATATATVTTAAGASPSASATVSQAASEPGIVGVTAGGALVVLNPADGAVTSTLVPSGVLGDEVAVAAGGMVYFAVQHGCTDQIESVADSGGSPVAITDGSLPAVSPDGSKLAYASQPTLSTGCMPSSSDLTSQYKLVVRTLSTGAQVTFHAVPKGQGSGLPAPISHLSWAPDNVHLAVSLSSVQDNEGWNLNLVDTATAHYYLSGAGISYVMPSGAPTPKRSYLREGVYLPDGNLFVSRACCAGVPIRNTSRLMQEVNTSGHVLHRVAVGYATLEHTSLAASPDGNWLLYLAAHDLYVSQGGATPREVGHGLIAAAWE